MELNDFRSSVLLLPAFIHLAAVASSLPDRIAKLERQYAGSLRSAEELLELDCVRGMRQLTDSARTISRDLAVPVLSVFAWCDVFEKCLMDGYTRGTGLVRLGTNAQGGSMFGDVYKIVDPAATRAQLHQAAISLLGHANRAVVRMRETVNMDIGLSDELLRRDAPEVGRRSTQIN